MILLDTDHLSVLTDERDTRHELLNARMEAAEEPFACTVVSVEEVLRGWLAFIHRERKVHRQIPGYRRLASFVTAMGRANILPFDEAAADQFVAFRQQRLRVGTMDLKIAAIALTHGALLLTANEGDFERVPGLRFENWL